MSFIAMIINSQVVFPHQNNHDDYDDDHHHHDGYDHDQDGSHC